MENLPDFHYDLVRMRKFVVLLISFSLPGLLGAQQLTLPPDASVDNVVIAPVGINGAPNLWGSPTTLGAYQISGDGYQNPLHPGASDQELGLSWNFSAPESLAADRQLINASGGTVRAIFVGETAGWLNDFGYTYSGHSSGPNSFTAWSQIQSFGPGANLKFGDNFSVTLAAGQMANFDFWFSATGVFGPRPTTLTDLGGVYMAFDPAESSRPTAQYLWSSSSIAVNTWIPSLATSMPVTTYLAGIEDWRIDRGSDRDYNDFVFALQFFNADGSPLAPVPEPGTWAAIAGVLSFAFVLIRRSRSSDAT
jgi:hypothetical protein